MSNQSADARAHATAACRVLVVDDDDTILATVVDALSLFSYPTATATNGEEALRRIEEFNPHVVLLDMRMPVLDGWGVARSLRERGLSPKVVVMTAAVDARQVASEIGANAFLAKPFGLDDLFSLVDRLCHEAAD
jgi:CheY-like chemotaxis protein